MSLFFIVFLPFAGALLPGLMNAAGRSACAGITFSVTLVAFIGLLTNLPAVLAGEDHPSLEVAVIAEVFKGGGHIVIDYKKVPPPQPTEAPARPADRTTRELTPRQIRKIQRAMGWVPSRSDLDALVSGWHPHKTR